MIWLVAGVTAGLSVAMAAGWAVQRWQNNGGWTDVVWAFALGAAGVTYALWPIEGSVAERQVLVAGLFGLWSLRLGLYLWHRVATSPEDARYAHFRKVWGDRLHPLMFGFLQVQALAASVLALAILAAAHNPTPFPAVTDALGLLLLVSAVAGEGLADEQLRRFKRESGHGGGVCDRGLWAWSRHPNYFFEWVGWLAWPVVAYDPAGGSWLGWLALSAPVIMYGLLVHGSGIPPLEERMLESRGETFRAYQRRTSPFFPMPPRSRP